MAVLAEYRDVGPPGYAVTAGIKAFEAGQSIMERKQRMRLNEQRMQQEQAEFVAKLPLLQAQSQLEVLNAAAAVKNATYQTQNESRAAVESTAAMEEYNNAIRYNVANEEGYVGGAVEDTPEGRAQQEQQAKYDAQATLEARLEKLRGMSVKYAYMKDLKNPGYSGFYDAITKSLIQTNEALHANLKIDELKTVQEMRNDALLAGRSIGAQATVESANIRASASTQNTDTRVAGRLEEQGLKNTGRLEQIKAQGQNQVEKDAKTIEYLSQEAVKADQDAVAVQNTDKALAAVLRGNARNLRDAIVKKSTYAGTNPSDVMPEGTAVPKKPAPADTTPPVSVSISIPGAKLYVVDEQSQTPQLAPSVKTPKDILSAYQQMVNDGVLSADEARAALTKLGFGHKK